MAHYYEISFYYGDKATKESLEFWGESGFSWYVSSREPLNREEAIAKCLAEHQDDPLYPHLVKAIPHCDGMYEVSAKEFQDGCGALPFEEDLSTH